MRPSSTYSRLLFPVIASADAVGLSIGLIIPLTSIVLVVPKVENNQIAPARHLVLRMVYIAPVAMGAGFFSGFLETAVLAFHFAAPETGKSCVTRREQSITGLKLQFHRNNLS